MRSHEITEHSYFRTQLSHRGLIFVLLSLVTLTLPVMAAEVRPGDLDPTFGQGGKVINDSIMFTARYIGDHDGVPSEVRKNGSIAFVRSDGDIWVMDSGGSGLTRLTSSPEPEFAPSWSPDGRKLAYLQSAETTVGKKYYLNIMNADGTQQVTLTSVILPNSSYSAGTISWSPDGDSLAFASFVTDLDSEIFTIKMDGSGLVNLTNDPEVQDGHPSFSPDGMRIAFVKLGSSGIFNSRIYIMNSDGSNVQLWGGDAYFSDSFGVKWSPDGTRLLYRTSLWGDCECMISQRVNGTGFVFLNLWDHTGGPADWSPDGTKAVFSNLNGIFIVGTYPPSSRPTNIGPPDGRQPDWQPQPVP